MPPFALDTGSSAKSGQVRCKPGHRHSETPAVGQFAIEATGALLLTQRIGQQSVEFP